MAQYPPPSSYFSGINYNYSFYSSSLYVSKSGDVMTGNLTAPTITAKTSIISPSIIYNGTELQSLSNLTNYYNRTASEILFLKTDGTNNMAAQLNLNGVSNNPLRIGNTNSVANNSIHFQNNIGNNAFIGYGGTTMSGNYANNFFIESSQSGIIFNTGGYTSTFTPRMYINPSGNVGIATTNPQYALDVTGNARVANGTSQTNFYIGNGFNSAVLNLWDISNAAWRIESGGYNLSFNNGSVGGSFTNKMIILQNGNVGIGSSNPKLNLEVGGTNPAVVVKAANEGQKAILYLATPSTPDSAYKCALIAEGLGSWSRSKFHITLNNTTDNTYPTYNASLADASFTFDYSGNMGLMNQNPISDGGVNCFMNIANSSLAGNSGNIILHKRDFTGGSRQYRIGITDGFYFSFGDFGFNNVAGTWVNQFTMHYNCPSNSLLIDSLGKCYSVAFIPTSDKKIKTDIRTIDNALWKVKQLRGVYYTHIIDGSKNIGLIAQEVEGIIPEVVSYNEESQLKGINYNNMVGLLINAIKEQQEIIENQGNQLKNIIDILNRNNIK